MVLLLRGTASPIPKRKRIKSFFVSVIISHETDNRAALIQSRKVRFPKITIVSLSPPSFAFVFAKYYDWH